MQCRVEPVVSVNFDCQSFVTAILLRDKDSDFLSLILLLLLVTFVYGRAMAIGNAVWKSSVSLDGGQRGCYG